MRPGKERDYFYAREVAEMLGVSKNTLFEWEKKGSIPKIPRDWRGWRMYNEGHLKQIKKLIEEKKRRLG